MCGARDRHSHARSQPKACENKIHSTRSLCGENVYVNLFACISFANINKGKNEKWFQRPAIKRKREKEWDIQTGKKSSRLNVTNSNTQRAQKMVNADTQLEAKKKHTKHTFSSILARIPRHKYVLCSTCYLLFVLPHQPFSSFFQFDVRSIRSMWKVFAIRIFGCVRILFDAMFGEFFFSKLFVTWQMRILCDDTTIFPRMNSKWPTQTGWIAPDLLDRKLIQSYRQPYKSHPHFIPVRKFSFFISNFQCLIV